MREMKDSGIEWIGKIPHDWVISKIRHIVQQNNNGIKIGPFGSALTNNTEGDAPYKVYGQANLVSGNFSDTKNKISKEIYYRLKNYEVISGDICISMMGTIGKCLTVPYNIEPGIMDSHLIKIRLSPNVDNRYFEYVYDKDKSGICFNQMQYEKKGSIMDGLNTTIVKGMYLPLPNINEQQIIANHLDKKCAELDQISADIQHQIEVLQEYKQSVITEAVTKGLDKNVAMKNSGIDWIGDIPAHWNVIPLKYLLSNDIDNLRVGPFGSELKSSEYVDDGFWVYNQRTVLDNNLDDNDTFITEEKYNVMRSFQIRCEDILITTRGTIGKICRIHKKFNKGIIHPCIIKFRIDSKKILYPFLELVFNSSKIIQDQLIYKSNATTIDVIYGNTLKNLQIPFPPISEQKKIQIFLNDKCVKIDSILTDKQKQLNTLTEYKKSLIYEYVTGKKEVPADA